MVVLMMELFPEAARMLLFMLSQKTELPFNILLISAQAAHQKLMAFPHLPTGYLFADLPLQPVSL